jgi:hypothetical protein
MSRFQEKTANGNFLFYGVRFEGGAGNHEKIPKGVQRPAN